MSRRWFPASKFCVDAGNVSIVDSAYISEHGGDITPPETTSIGVEPGKYRVKLVAPRTWNGKRQITRTIHVRGRSLVVGDICYSFSNIPQDKWEDFIRDTSCFDVLGSKSRRRGASLDTGGDGLFDVEVFVERLD